MVGTYTSQTKRSNLSQEYKEIDSILALEYKESDPILDLYHSPKSTDDSLSSCVAIPHKASSSSSLKEELNTRVLQRCLSKDSLRFKSRDSLTKSLDSLTPTSLTNTPVKSAASPVSLRLNTHSKSEVLCVPSTPDLSIRRIYAVKSLNDILFSEEEYDMASV